MKLSEAIRDLQEFMTEHGDLEIVKLEDVDGNFEITGCNVIDIIEVPKNAYVDLNSTNPDDFDKMVVIDYEENLNRPDLRVV